MSQFLAGFHQALRAVFKDKAAVAALFLAVIIYSFYYPVAYRHQVATQMPTVVVDLDRSPMSRLLVRKMAAVPALDLVAQVESMRRARQLVERGVADGIVLIDERFQRDIQRGQQGRLAFYGAGAYLGRSSTVLTGLADAVAAFSREVMVQQARVEGPVASVPLTLVQRPLYNTREGYASTVVAGVSVLIVQQTLLLTIVLLAATRRERLGRRLQAPIMQLCGGMTAFWVLGMLNLLYYAGFVFWFQDFPRGGNWPGLVLGGAFFVSAVVSLGALVGSFFRVREQAIHAVLLTAMPMYFLSGLSWPPSLMPEALVWLAKLVPTTPGINLVIKMNEMGADLSEAWAEMVNLAVLAVGYAGLAIWRYRSLSSRCAVVAS
ncbi:MAG: ABC transporter permease [Lautropia sp.]|nr:ABC transporter permease [Lautropia sp.]